jgi:hypothetical protein
VFSKCCSNLIKVSLFTLLSCSQNVVAILSKYHYSTSRIIKYFTWYNVSNSIIYQGICIYRCLQLIVS